MLTRPLRAGRLASLGGHGEQDLDGLIVGAQVHLRDEQLGGAAAPCLYVFDEPTAALTASESTKLFDVIARLKAQGAAVLYVSHRMDEVMALADRITVLRDGAHVATRARAATMDIVIG